MEKFVGVGSSRDDHGGVGASSHNTLVMGDVLGDILISVHLTIRILVLILGINYSRSSSKSLRT